mmetsp:Transcript_67535/g.133277  ORF Transcript_67535/g.133277 Transcript_67535/m.133277 type:complete len:120 (+) Transcript_67535:79-438(+)
MATGLEAMGPADAVVFGAKLEMEISKMSQKLCWERCSDTMLSSTEVSSTLPKPTQRCLDACVQKFSDTAVLVSMEKQSWEMQALRQQQMQTLVSRTVWGTVATAAVVGLGCYLLRSGDD